MKLPRNIVVCVDTREKYPLTFPKYIKWWGRGSKGGPLLLPVRVIRAKLDAGDYHLRYFHKDCVIERKATLEELSNNLFTADWTRQQKAFQKLARSCKYPVLLLEMGMGGLLRYSHMPDSQRWKLPDPEAVQDKLMRVCAYYGIHLWMTGGGRSGQARTTLGAMMLRLMLSQSIGRRWDDRIEHIRARVQKSGEKFVEFSPTFRRAGDILWDEDHVSKSKTS